MGRLALFAALLIYSVSPIHAQEFPQYTLRPGRLATAGDPFSALSSASLCVKAPARACFALEFEKFDGIVDYFYMEPKAQRFTSFSGEHLVLFNAHTMGGSGCAYDYALLLSRGGRLINLLPRVMITNISDVALWSMPDLSPMPLFLTADYIWEDGAHYSSHRYQIRGYLYSADASKYHQVFSYSTRRNYPSADLTSNEVVHVLDAERARINEHVQPLHVRHP